MWSVLGTVAVLGLLGVIGFRSSVFVSARGVLTALSPWPVALLGDGIGSQATLWTVLALVVYPILLDRGLAKFYPSFAVASYAALALLPESSIAGLDLATRIALFLGTGHLVWLLGYESDLLVGEREEAATEARRAEGRFRVAFASASSGMAMIGLDGLVLQANQAFSDLVDRPVEDLIDFDWLDLVHPDDRPELSLRIDALTGTEVWSFRHETRFLRPDRRPAWGILGVAMVMDDDGEPGYFFANVQDITERKATEERLRTREEHYRNLFGRSPVPTWEMDFTAVGTWLEQLRRSGVTDLRDYFSYRREQLREAIALIDVVDVNEAVVSLLEAGDRNDLLNGIPVRTVTDDTLDAVAEQLCAIWEGRDRVERPVVTQSLRGRRIDVIQHWVAPVVDGKLDLSKVVVAYFDITEYKRTEEALRRIEERLRTVVSGAPIVLFALDQHGVFTLSEGQGLSVLGMSGGEAVGRSIFEMFRDSPQMISSVRRALTGEAFTTSVELRNVAFDIRFAPIWEEGKVAGVIGVANDITERKRASERLEELVRSKDEFVASVSHELRTPLTAVVGFAQELRSGLDRFAMDDLRMFVSLIAEQAVEVADLVEDLLVAARVDIDKVAIASEAIFVPDQIESALVAWKEDSRKLEVATEPVKAFADPIRVRQILRNLITNAQRYGGDQVTISAAAVANMVRVLVMDDGPGIAARDREKIFEPYHRAHRFEGQPASVGLGLTVSRQLARLMGGDLTYRYEDGWSVFELLLPADV